MITAARAPGFKNEEAIGFEAPIVLNYDHGNFKTMARVLVEKIFDPPISEEKWNQDVAIGIPCHNAHNVRWIRSLMARDRSRVICEFEAPDAETVRRSFRKAGLPFARIWTIDILEPAADDDGTIRTKGWHLEKTSLLN